MRAVRKALVVLGVALRLRSPPRRRRLPRSITGSGRSRRPGTSSRASAIRSPARPSGRRTRRSARFSTSASRGTGAGWSTAPWSATTTAFPARRSGRVGDTVFVHFKNSTRPSTARTRCTSTRSSIRSRPTAPSSPASRAAARTSCRGGRSRTACATRARGRVAVPRPLALDARLDRRRDVRNDLHRREARAAREAREHRRVRPAPRLPDAQRPRVHRQHADLPLSRGRDGAVERHGDRQRASHVPPARAPLERSGGHIDTKTLGPAESFRFRIMEDVAAPGSTTATSRPTWSSACRGSTRFLRDQARRRRSCDDGRAR